MHDAGRLGRDAASASTPVAGALLFLAVLFVDPDRYLRLTPADLLRDARRDDLRARGRRCDARLARWIDVGFFTFQPSEFGKVVFVLALAGFVAERVAVARRARRRRSRSSATGSVPIVLVFVQPDIGTALVYAAALAAVLFVAGVRWSHLAVLLTLTVAVALSVLWLLPAAGVNVLKPYQAARLTGFTHPANDPRGATYNLTQSITAVGAGGLRGRGVQGATQTRLDYLPEHATDFAFASLSEEHGFFGASILLLLYLLVVWRALKIVRARATSTAPSSRARSRSCSCSRCS